MTKEEYKRKICPSCVNYNYKRSGEQCAKFIELDDMIMCKNFRDWKGCIKKSCRACRMCEGE